MTLFDQEHTAILEEELVQFMETVRLIRLNYHKLDQNQGVANALKIGLEKCSYELIARMDADDVSLPTRFEKQIEAVAIESSKNFLETFIGFERLFVSQPLNEDVLLALQEIKSECSQWLQVLQDLIEDQIVEYGH